MKPTGIAEYVFEHDGPYGWRFVCERCVEDALHAYSGHLPPQRLALHGVRAATLDTGGPFICYLCGARYSRESRRWGRAAYTGKLKMEIPKDFREATERLRKKYLEPWMGNQDLFGSYNRQTRNAEDARIRAEIERQSFQQYNQIERAERKRRAQMRRELRARQDGDTHGIRKRWRRRVVRRLRRWLRCIDHFRRSGDTFGRRTAIEAAQDFRDRGAMGLEKRKEWRAYR